MTYNRRNCFIVIPAELLAILTLDGFAAAEIRGVGRGMG